MNVEKARQALESMDDFARMAGVNPIGPYKVLKEFIDEAEIDQQFIEDAFEFHTCLDLDVEFIRERRKNQKQ